MKHLLNMYKNDFSVVLDFRDINRYIAVFIKLSFSSEKNDPEYQWNGYTVIIDITVERS